VLSGYDIGLIGAALDVKPNAAAVPMPVVRHDIDI